MNIVLSYRFSIFFAYNLCEQAVGLMWECETLGTKFSFSWGRFLVPVRSLGIWINSKLPQIGLWIELTGKIFFSQWHKLLGKRIPSSPNRSWTYDLPHTGWTLCDWATGDSLELQLSGRASDRCAEGHRFDPCWKNSEFVFRVVCVIDWIVLLPSLKFIKFLTIHMKLTFLYSELSQTRHSQENWHFIIDVLLFFHSVFVVPLTSVNTAHKLTIQPLPIIPWIFSLETKNHIIYQVFYLKYKKRTPMGRLKELCHGIQSDYMLFYHAVYTCVTIF